ncbi:6-phosphogluconolactonase [Candidatus Gracilibacteria bacterium]|nr:6-phosphogluconolactonase [Candidatus Gracilibacteria bacterium]
MQIHQPKITQFENSQVFYNKATEIIIDQILDTTSQEGLARICLSGGSTPLPIYSQLSKNSNLNWYDIELFQTDERFIDPSSEESNQFQIEKALTPKILDNLKHFYKINTTLEKKLTLELYNEVIESLSGVFFDLTILGIGKDGHFASLFPDQEYLGHNDSRVIATTAPKTYSTRPRISLTIETILNSKMILVLLKGKEKQVVINELLEGKLSAQEFPAKFLLSHPNLSIFFTEK